MSVGGGDEWGGLCSTASSIFHIIIAKCHRSGRRSLAYVFNDMADLQFSADTGLKMKAGLQRGSFRC